MSVLRDYEVTILLHPNMDDQKRNDFIETMTGRLTTGEGDEAIKPTVDHWGRRSLAYPIRDQNDAYYVYFEATMESDAIRPIEKDLNFIDDVMRYLFVRKEEIIDEDEESEE